MEYFTFKAAEKYLGVEVRYIQGVIDEARITPVPLLPFCHLGLLYHRGELFDVVDVGALLGQEKGLQAVTERKGYRVILLKWSQRKLALASDEIIGLTWLDDKQGERDAYSMEGYNIEVITPDHIWEILSGLSYGYHEV